MIDNVLLLAWPGRHPEWLRRRRDEAIVGRVRSIALFFAVLTTAWIPVDAWIFAPDVWPRLAGARVIAALALFLLAASSRPAEASPAGARMRLLALYAIPAAFYVATREMIRGVPATGVAAGVAAAYEFVPFMLAAGISVFPLTLAESLVLAAAAFALQRSAEMEAFWLLLLIAGVAAFAAVSHLRLLAALVQQAVRDPLTHCLRREAGHELLDAQFLLAIRNHQPLTVMFADIDHFKLVNDEFGHDVGDRVLADVARSLRSVLRDSDVLVRWGGEEFVLVLPHTAIHHGVALIMRLRTHGFARLPDGAAVSLSFGVAEYRRDGLGTAAELVAAADQRMYRAKLAGRNRYADSTSGPPEPILQLA